MKKEKKMTRKIFRLFISSTFSDFKRERRVLQTKVFPKVKEYASSKGYTFQPIDLRWGVSNEAQNDQRTLELCLSEVRACKTHIRPNFLIMLGDRYGWTPLPYAIEQDEFQEILKQIENKQLVKEWYELDKNQIPASYILKERTNEYTEYKKWETVENSLRDTLQTAVKESSISEEKTRKYFLSATEAEVEEGIISYIEPTKFQVEELLKKDPELKKVDPKYIFGFLRSVDKTTQVEDKFITNDYDKAQAFKQRVADVLVDENTLEITTKQVDKETLEETYMLEFEKRMLEFLFAQIDTQKSMEEQEKLSPLQTELLAQSYFAKNKRKNFLGQTEILKRIESYVDGEGEEPLVIYGESGRGKSSLISKAIQTQEEASKAKVVYRFVSATPFSSSSKEILVSIFEELGKDIRSEEDKKENSEKLQSIGSKQESFEEFSYRVYGEIMNIKEQVVIFIDAVDQLQNEDNFLWLPRKLRRRYKLL